MPYHYFFTLAFLSIFLLYILRYHFCPFIWLLRCFYSSDIHLYYFYYFVAIWYLKIDLTSIFYYFCMLISYNHTLTFILVYLYALFLVFLIIYTANLKSVLKRLKTSYFDVWDKTGHFYWHIKTILCLLDSSFFMVSEMSDIILFMVLQISQYSF